MARDDEKRFWAKVQKTKTCWLWTAAINEHGYGVFGVDGGRKVVKAHRFSYSLAHKIPRGLFVLHRCDIRACVRPDHLFVGTHQDNMADMILKGRDRKATGEENGRAKLTAESVRRIRRERGSSRAVGQKFGVSHVAVQKIRRGELWRHV